jgi:subtilisin family serine protease
LGFRERQVTTTTSALVIAFIFVSALLQLAPVSFGEPAVANAAQSVPTEFVVGFRREYGIPEAGRQLVVSSGGQILKELSHPALNAIVVRVPSRVADAFQSAMRRSPLVRYVDPNGNASATIVPNDPMYVSQWALPKIQAPQVWEINTGSASVRVGVIDTGIDYTHPDVAPNYLACGYDWVNNDAYPMDDNGHGTHVAGTIAAQTNNGLGVAGVAGGWGSAHGVTLIAEKVLNSQGVGYWDDVASGITHAVDTCHVNVINLSLGGWGLPPTTLQDALQYAAGKGVITVVAAGNDNYDAGLGFYPCAYSSGHPKYSADIVMCVSATDPSDNRAGFSNYGDPIEISAPGVNIWSTIPSGSYGYKSGTSMATPYVAAVVALVMSQFPTYTRDQVWTQVLAGADDLGAPGWDKYFGWGRVNAYQALSGFSNVATVTFTTTSTLTSTVYSTTSTTTSTTTVGTTTSYLTITSGTTTFTSTFTSTVTLPATAALAATPQGATASSFSLINILLPISLLCLGLRPIHPVNRVGKRLRRRIS